MITFDYSKEIYEIRKWVLPLYRHTGGKGLVLYNLSHEWLLRLIIPLSKENFFPYIIF